MNKYKVRKVNIHDMSVVINIINENNGDIVTVQSIPADSYGPPSFLVITSNEVEPFDES